MFLKIFFEMLLIFLGIPGAIVGFLLLLGVEIGLPVAPFPAGPIILVFVVIGAGAEATYRAIKKDREKATVDFYSINIKAKIERAHYALYQVHKKGLLYKNGDQKLKHEWDREAQKTIRTYCVDAGIDTYLTYMGRLTPDAALQPPTDEQYNEGLRFIKELLDGETNIYLKT